MKENSPRISSESTIREEEPFLSKLTAKPEKDRENSIISKGKRGRLEIILIVVSAIFLVASGAFFSATFKDPTDAQCTQQMSTWSPMFEAVEYELRHYKTEGPNVYYGKPTASLEEAWDRLWQVGFVGIPETKMPLLNKTLDMDWTYVPEELGGGITAFFEVFHQLHCLNFVRQYSYRDEYNYSNREPFMKASKWILSHAEHCIESLRVNAMCTADTTPYLIEQPEYGKVILRTDALYRCRKFEPLMAWANKNVVQPYNETEEIIKHHPNHNHQGE